jgi:hypothetical protein
MLIVRPVSFEIPVSDGSSGDLLCLAFGDLKHILGSVQYFHVPPQTFPQDISLADSLPALLDSIEHVATRGVYAPQRP